MFCQVKQKYKNLDVKVATDKNVSVIFFASPFTYIDIKIKFFTEGMFLDRGFSLLENEHPFFAFS